MINQLEPSFLSNLPVVLVVCSKVGSLCLAVSKDRIHHHRYNFTGGTFLEDPVDHLIEVAPGMLDGGSAHGDCIVDRKLDQNTIRAVTQNFVLQVFHSPVGVGSPLCSIDQVHLTGELLVENFP